MDLCDHWGKDSCEPCKEVHKSFKGIIPNLSRADSLQIGEIYLKVCKENSVEIQDCLQNFMYHCVLAKSKKVLFINRVDKKLTQNGV